MTCDNCDLPDIRNGRYFPTISIIHAHMVSVRTKIQLSLIDYEALKEKINIRKQEDPSIKIFFRPKSTEAVNNDYTKDNIEAEAQEMKFKNEDSVDNNARIEDDIEEEEEEQEMTFKTEDSIIPCYLFTKQNGNVVFFNDMVEKCYCWTQRAKQNDMFYFCSSL